MVFAYFSMYFQPLFVFQCMSASFFNLASQYPFYHKGKDRFIFSAIIFLMSFGFNYFFEPFDTNFTEHKLSYFWIHLIHAAVSVVIFLLLSFSLEFFNIKEEDWTLKKELIFIAGLLLLVGVSQFLIRDIIYNNPNNWNVEYLVEEVLHTSLVGFLFACILLPMNQLLLFKKYAHQAILLNNKRENSISETPPIYSQQREAVFIQTAIEQENFDLDIDNFLYAKSEGNYIEIHILSSDQNATKLLKRSTLTNFSKQLSDFDFILQVHRSYLINLKKVTGVSGNAQGYKLELLDSSQTVVPVSRSHLSVFQEKWAVFRP